MNPVKYDVLQRKKEIIARELKILREIQKRRKSDKRDEILEHALLVDTDFLFSLTPKLIKDTRSFIRQLEKSQL